MVLGQFKVLGQIFGQLLRYVIVWRWGGLLALPTFVCEGVGGG